MIHKSYIKYQHNLYLLSKINQLFLNSVQNIYNTIILSLTLNKVPTKSFEQ